MRLNKKNHTEFMWINTQNCKTCWKCIDVCPKQVIGKVVFLWHKHIVVRNGKNCTGCGKCIKICPYEVFVNTKKQPEMK